MKVKPYSFSHYLFSFNIKIEAVDIPNNWTIE
jgi:hypothetical protein